MSKLIYKMLWFFLHTIDKFLRTVYTFIRRIRFQASRFGTRPGKHRSDEQIIRSIVRKLPKIPKHVCIIVDNKKLVGSEIRDRCKCLSKIAIWLGWAGVECISFYDLQGFSSTEISQIYTNLTSSKEQHKIEINYFYTSGSNGHVDGQPSNLLINFFGLVDGKQKLVDVCKAIARERQQNEPIPKQLDIELMNDRLSNEYSFLTEPELAIYFGDICCTYGMLPWHIRLTEFIKLDTDNRLNVNSFLSTLYTYAKCEQRFGN